MAITKIMPIHSHLKQAIRYALNPEKTANGQYTYALNCRGDDPSKTHKAMIATQKRFGKHKAADRKNVQAHHIIQSFAPGEVTPKLAYKIATEFVSHYLGDKYEAVVGIHTDHGHIHAHIVFNAVSCVDGKKYESTPKEYFEKIRGLSDELCEKYGLSVIRKPSEGRALHYGEWRLNQLGGMTWKDMIRSDIDQFIETSTDYHNFLAQMKDAGYDIKQGKHVAFRPYGKERFVRGYKLDGAYDEEAIKRRIEESITGHTRHVEPPRYLRRSHKPYKKGRRVKLTGWQALYWRYLYQMGKAGRKPPSSKPHAEIRKELAKLNEHRTLLAFMYEHKIHGASDLLRVTEALQGRLDVLSSRKESQRAEAKALRPAFINLRILLAMQDGYDMYQNGNAALKEEYDKYQTAKGNLVKLGYDTPEILAQLIQTKKAHDESEIHLDTEINTCKRDLKHCGKIAAYGVRLSEQERQQTERQRESEMMNRERRR